MSDITINAAQYRTLVAAGINVEEFLAGGGATAAPAPAEKRADGRNHRARKVMRVRVLAPLSLAVVLVAGVTIPPAIADVACSGAFCTVGGGNGNTATATYTTVGGGNSNSATNLGATIGGGHSGSGSGIYSTIGGGYEGQASGNYATVGGGQYNGATSSNATIAGGFGNSASAESATVAGGTANWVSASYGTIAGGGPNNDNSTPANRVTDSYGAVGGGGGNQAGNGTASLIDRIYATVAGGLGNIASGSYSSVAGGRGNTASGSYAVASGGDANTATGDYSSVAGGRSNTASGSYAVVPGGYTNTASGSFSFAAGRQAKATQAGSFVWGDNHAANISATAPNQFIARASGGVTFYSNAAATTGVFLPAGGGGWSNLSDRSMKANFAAVDAASILERVAALPIQLWNYKSQDADTRHIGPMAQDFAAAFGVGENDTTISTVDADGVALAAIQGLYQENQQLERDLAALKAQVDSMRSR